MSKYTTQIRYICEEKAGYLESTDDYTAVIDRSYDKIIHPDTPLYDPAYAPILYKKIIRHYYFDEIAHETVGRFIFRINTKLDEILPYYNKLYESAVMQFNPLYDVDYYIEGNKEDTGTDSHTRTDHLNQLRTDNLERGHNLTRDTERTDDLANSASSSTTDLFSDTPEGSLTGVEDASYLTNARKTDSTASGTNTGTQTTVETVTDRTEDTGTQNIANTGTQTNAGNIHNINEYAEHVWGKRGSASYMSLVREFRDNIINIDMMIIEELRPLFMQVF